MDKSVLLEKRKNLLTQNKNSYELFLNQNYIDPTLFFDYQTLLDFINNPTIEKLIIDKSELTKKVDNLFSSIKDANTLNEIIKKFNLPLEQSQKITEQQLSKKTNDTKKEYLNNLFQLLDSLLNLSSRSQNEYFDKSIWTLYLSYGSLIGNTQYPNKEDILLRSPLINIEISISLNDKGNVVISKHNEGYLVSNEVLLNTLSNQYEIKFEPLNNFQSTENENYSELNNNYLNYLQKTIPNTSFDENNQTYNKISKPDILKLYPNNLVIQKNFVISLINIVGGKLLKDYDQLLEQDYEFPVVDSIFTNNLNSLVYEKDELFELNNPMNLVQKLAVVNSLNQNLLIYGPPGTGKSEVVLNIVANALTTNKNILVVSEKKAALDVIERRMFASNKLIMSAFDSKTKNEFFQKILSLNQLILYSNNVKLYPQDCGYQKIIEYIDLINSFKNYVDCFNNKLDKFLSIYNRIDQKIYLDNLKIISSLRDLVIHDKLNIEQLVKQVNNLNEFNDSLNKLLPNFDINIKIFNKELLNQFLNKLSNINDKDLNFIVLNFLQNSEILDKKPLFGNKFKNEKDVDIKQVIELLNSIMQKDIVYIDKFQDYYKFFNNNQNYLDYLIYYDWISKTKILNFIDTVKNKNNIDYIIHNYWNNKKLYASKFDKMLLDYYASNLRQQILVDKELDKKWTELVRKANLQHRPSINRTIKEYYDVLRKIFPIWILSPDSAASILPLNKGEFDLGIFDESSQMRIERGIPLIYRCKNSIISGDDKQLKPTSFFTKINELGEEFVGHLDNVDSLLDKAKTSNWLNYTLLNHYRSVNEELIHYSNHYFYNDKLVCITKNNHFNKSIEVIENMGVYNRDKSINEDEINKVVQILSENYDKYKSIIVITFNAKQAEYIQMQANVNPKLRLMIENNSLKVRSLENVQGDEGDLVILSCTFGMDKNGKFIQNFGPINQDGGANRLNVMFTRAKEKMIVVKSFKAADILNEENQNTRIFKGFLQYIEQLQVNNEIVTINKENIVNDEPHNYITQGIIEKLNNAPNIQFEINKLIGTHTIDLCVKLKDQSDIKVVLFIDDNIKFDYYLSDKTTFIRDIDKQKYYEDRNYHTIRTNLIEWIVAPDKVINAIKNLLAISN